MKMQGKVVGSTQEGDSLRLSCDVSEYRDGSLYERRMATVDVPMRNAQAYYVGRPVRIEITPLLEEDA